MHTVSSGYSIYGPDVRAHQQQFFERTTVIQEVFHKFPAVGFKLVYRPFHLYAVRNAERESEIFSFPLNAAATLLPDNVTSFWTKLATGLE